VIKNVATQLGNTPAVCRKCYIHPTVLEAFAQGKLPSVECPEEALRKLVSGPQGPK